jgi:hypothetical protein
VCLLSWSCVFVCLFVFRCYSLRFLPVSSLVLVVALVFLSRLGLGLGFYVQS